MHVQVIAPTSDTLLHRLRLGTRAAHHALEARLRPSERWTTPRLLAFLRGTLAVVQVCEPGLRKYFDEATFPLLHGASRRLRHDIRMHGELVSVPDMDDIDMRGRAEVFGAAYVILGSQFGGQIIGPAVSRDLGIAGDTFTYFAGPEEVGKAWTSFADALAEWDGQASDDLNDVTLRSAVNIFGAFTRAFSREGLDAL